MKYHLCKSTRIYRGEPYCGYSSGDAPCESNSLDEALALQTDLQKTNPVGWNIWDSETQTLVVGVDYFIH